MPMRGGDWAAVIAAGGAAEKDIREISGVENKALVPFRGRLSGEIVASACLEAGIPEVVVVADQTVRKSLANIAGVTFAEPGVNAIRSAQSGLSKLSEPKRVLFLSADLPLLTAESLREFIELSHAADGFSAGLIREEALQSAYPGAPAKYVRFREGRFVAASVYGGSHHAFEKAIHVLENAVRNRKSQLKLLWQFGIGNLLRYGFGWATLKQAESALSRALGTRTTLITTAHPATAMDFDNAEDLQYIQSLFDR